MANNTLEVSLALKASGFRSEIQNIKKDNQLLKAEFDKLASSVDKFEDTLEGKKAKLQLVTKEYENAKKQVEIYKKQVELSRKAVEEANAELNRQKSAIESTKKQIQDYSAAYGETSDVVKALEKELEQLEKDFDKQAKAVVSANTQYQNMQTQLARAETAVNELGNELNECARDVSELDKKLNSLGGRLKDTGSNISSVGSSIKNVGGQITDVGKKFAVVSAGATATGVSLFNMAESFTQGMNKVNTLVDLSSEELNEYSKQLKQVAKDTGGSLTDLSESMYQAISASVPLEDSIKAVEVATKLSKGGFTDSATAIDMLTSAINAMGLSYDEVETISDKFIATQNAGKTTIAEMASSIGQVAPTASAAGLSLDELLASVATLTANGTATSEAMTAMKAALSNIIKPSTQASNLAKELGLEFSSTALASKGLAGFLADVQEKTKGNVDDMALLFGSTEALNAIVTLTGQGNEKFVESLESISNASGDTQDAFDKMSASAGQRFSKAINELKINFMDLGDKLAPIVELLANGVSKVAEAFGNMGSTTQTVIVAIGALLAIISPLIIILGTVVASIGSVISFVGTLVTGIGTLIGWISSAIGIVSSFVAALNPITLVIAGVAAAVVGLGVLIYHNWESVKQWTLDMVENIKAWFEEMKEKFNEVIANIQKIWNTYGQPLIDNMKEMFDDTRQAFANAWNSIKELFKSVCNAIKSVWDTILLPVIELIGAYVYLLWLQHIKPALDSIKKGWQEMVNKIKEVWENTLRPVIDSIKQGWQDLCNKFKEFYEAKIKPTLDALKNIVDDVKGAITKAFNAIGGVIDSTISGIVGSIQKGIDKIKELFDWISSATSKVGDFINKLNPFSKSKSIDMDMSVNGDIPNIRSFDIPINPIGDVALSGSYYNSNTPLSDSLAKMTSMANSIPSTNQLQSQTQSITMKQDNSQIEAILEKYLGQFVQAMANFNPSIELNGRKVSEELNIINGQGLKLNERWR